MKDEKKYLYAAIISNNVNFPLYKYIFSHSSWLQKVNKERFVIARRCGLIKKPPWKEIRLIKREILELCLLYHFMSYKEMETTDMTIIRRS